MTRMYGTHITPQERDANLDRVTARFLEGNRLLRGFDIVGGRGFAAMIDSESAQDDEVFVWTGRWPEQPVGLELPPIELAVAGSGDDLCKRRKFTTGALGSDGDHPVLRAKDGGLVLMKQVTAPGFRHAWVGDVDGAVVGLFCRAEIDPDIVVTELDDVRPMLAGWRALVDANTQTR